MAKKPGVDDDGYPVKPIKNRDGSWFYIEKTGLEVCIEGAGEVWKATIPWAHVTLATMARSHAKPRRSR